MDRKEIETKVLIVLTAVLKCNVVLESRRKDHVQWDSLKHIELVFAVEDELNIQFPEDVLVHLDSVESIVENVLVLTHAA